MPFWLFLHVAHEPPKNVLIAELYSREDWERSFAFYEGFTEAGWLIGLVLGFATSVTNFFGGGFQLLLCSALNLVALGLSVALVADPVLVFERSLVNIEKSVDFAYRGVLLASRVLDGATVNRKLKRENSGVFCVGLVLFSLATSILFTPMPIFVSSVVQVAGLSASFVFALFVLNSAGGVFGYMLVGLRQHQQTGKPNVSRIVAFRGLLSFLLVLVGFSQSPLNDVMIVGAILVLMGFAYAVFLVYTLSLSMELIPSGKAGLFNVFIGAGGACGSFLGPLIATQTLAFVNVFAVAGVIFFLAYMIFKVFV